MRVWMFNRTEDVMSRISCPILRTKLTTAETAAALIHDGDNVGMSGFTGAGYPKALPGALAARMIVAHERGEPFRIGLWTGASTAPDADGVLAAAHGISTRLPYNSDPTLRALINSGEVDYIDAHLSHSAQHMWFGFYGNLDVAVVEVTAALPGGRLVPRGFTTSTTVRRCCQTGFRSSWPTPCSASASLTSGSTRPRWWP